MSLEIIKQHLINFRLFTAASEIEAVMAAQKKSVPLDWLQDLLSREADVRKEKAILKRKQESRVSLIWTS